MTGTVRLIEPLGDATLVFFEYGNGTRLVAKIDPDLVYKSGDSFRFTFDPANCHLFDPESGVRLN